MPTTARAAARDVRYQIFCWTDLKKSGDTSKSSSMIMAYLACWRWHDERGLLTGMVAAQMNGRLTGWKSNV